MLGARTFCQLLDFFGKLAYCHQVQLIPPRGVTRMAMNIFYAKHLLHEWPNQFIHPVCHCQTLVSKIPLHSTESIYSILYKIDNKRCCCALTFLAVSSNYLDNLAYEQKKIYNEI